MLLFSSICQWEFIKNIYLDKNNFILNSYGVQNIFKAGFERRDGG